MTHIDVVGNRIRINKRQPLLNARNLKLNELFMNGNSMKTIYCQTFNGFFNLSTLKLEYMGIKTIEEGAFRDLSNIACLNLLGNELSSLPRGLFKSLGKLRKLVLQGNKLQALPDLRGLPSHMNKLYLGNNHLTDIFSLSEFGIKSVTSLGLEYNNITRLPKHVFQKISASTINLAFNKIKEILGYSFTASTILYDLYLDSNGLVSISEKAFSSVRSLKRLTLSRNKINFLPPGIFTNLSMKWIFLYDNNISSIRNTWKGVKEPPQLILLFDNPLRMLSADSLEGLRENSKIHINCNSLLEISGVKKTMPVVQCSPSVSLHVVAPTESTADILQRFGFECKETTGPLPPYIYKPFNCTPCPLGYYKGNKCKRCPAGSFYQNKLLQTSCKRCTKGQYVPLEKAPGRQPLDCLTCPDGTQTYKSAEYRACFCLQKFARLSRFGPCTKCTTEGIQCKREYRMLRPGFWWSWAHNETCKRKYQAFIENLETFNDSYSRTTYSFDDCTLPLPHQCSNKEACLGNVHGSCHQNCTMYNLCREIL